MRKRSMVTNNADQESCKKDTVWVFLAIYSLDELMRIVESGDDSAAGMPFQDLGIPLKCLNPMIRILADIAYPAMMHAHPGTPAMIRLFCQEKMLKAGKPAETMRSKQTVASSGIILQADPKMTGGWGYFLVVSSGDFPEDRPASPPNLIDLYLYNEGR